MWQSLYNFMFPTPELQAVRALPAREQIKQLGRWSYWRLSFRWPVIWRRIVLTLVTFQLWNVGYFAVRGFQTVALERQQQAGAVLALDKAAQGLRNVKVGSVQYFQAREKMRDALRLVAASANIPRLQLLADMTQVQVNPFDQYDDDGGWSAFCKHLELSSHDDAGAATQRTRVAVRSLFCSTSPNEYISWDNLPSETRPGH